MHLKPTLRRFALENRPVRDKLARVSETRWNYVTMDTGRPSRGEGVARERVTRAARWSDSDGDTRKHPTPSAPRTDDSAAVASFLATHRVKKYRLGQRSKPGAIARKPELVARPTYEDMPYAHVGARTIYLKD
jgi:hypothetical protein